jgi:putative ABC transport system permease protein
LPGVEAVCEASAYPGFGGRSSITLVRLPQAEGRDVLIGVHHVSPNYFQNLPIPLLAGRMFSGFDRGGAGRVAILNETAAQRLFPGEDPIGRKMGLALWPQGQDQVEIVGVAADVRHGGFSERARPEVYLSSRQSMESGAFLLVRARTAGAAALAPAVRREVLALDRNVPIYDVWTMQERVMEATSQARLSAVLLGLFAGMALALAAIGVYGVTAYAVAARTREMGVRMALGAQRRDLMALVFRQSAAMVFPGLLLGVIASLGLTRVLATLLYEVAVRDWVTFVTGCLLLAGTALLASYVPARRAASVDPMAALRYE